MTLIACAGRVVQVAGDARPLLGRGEAALAFRLALSALSALDEFDVARRRRWRTWSPSTQAPPQTRMPNRIGVVGKLVVRDRGRADVDGEQAEHDGRGPPEPLAGALVGGDEEECGGRAERRPKRVAEPVRAWRSPQWSRRRRRAASGVQRAAGRSRAAASTTPRGSIAPRVVGRAPQAPRASARTRRRDSGYDRQTRRSAPLVPLLDLRYVSETCLIPDDCIRFFIGCFLLGRKVIGWGVREAVTEAARRARPRPLIPGTRRVRGARVRAPHPGSIAAYAFLALTVEEPWHLPTNASLPLNDFVAAA